MPGGREKTSEQREKNRVTVASLAAAVLLTSAKLVVGLLTGSLGLLAEAAHSALDAVASVVTFFSVRVAGHSVWPTAVTAALAIELFVLAVFAGGWLLFAGPEPSGKTVLALISLSSLAMGVQSSAVRRLGVPGVATTYITGTLTNLTEGAIEWLRTARYPKSLGEGDPESPEPAPPSARGLLLPADVWLAYGSGAVAGGAAQLLWWPIGVLLPAGVVAVVVCIAAASHRRDRR